MKEKTKTPMKTVAFDLRWHDAIQELSSFERIEMYEAIMAYAKDGTEMETQDRLKRMALRMIYDQIDEQRKCLEDMMA